MPGGTVDSTIGKTIAQGHDEAWDKEAFAQVEPVHALQAEQPLEDEAAPITPLEVAKCIIFLVSDQARTINGVSLPVDRALGAVGGSCF